MKTRILVAVLALSAVAFVAPPTADAAVIYARHGHHRTYYVRPYYRHYYRPYVYRPYFYDYAYVPYRYYYRPPVVVYPRVAVGFGRPHVGFFFGFGF